MRILSIATLVLVAVTLLHQVWRGDSGHPVPLPQTVECLGSVELRALVNDLARAIKDDRALASSERARILDRLRAALEERGSGDQPEPIANEPEEAGLFVAFEDMPESWRQQVASRMEWDSPDFGPAAFYYDPEFGFSALLTRPEGALKSDPNLLGIGTAGIVAQNRMCRLTQEYVERALDEGSFLVALNDVDARDLMKTEFDGQGAINVRPDGSLAVVDTRPLQFQPDFHFWKAQRDEARDVLGKKGVSCTFATLPGIGEQ